jgi:hypothetical protein
MVISTVWSCRSKDACGRWWMSLSTAIHTVGRTTFALPYLPAWSRPDLRHLLSCLSNNLLGLHFFADEFLYPWDDCFCKS